MKIYHRLQQAPGLWRLWLIGQNRADETKTAIVQATTTDPDTWLTENETAALDALDAGDDPPAWYSTYTRLKTLAQSTVGVDLADLSDLQIKALLAVILHEHRAFGADGTVRPLGEWVKRRLG